MSEENKSWIANVFDSLSNGFSKIIEAIRKHGILFAIASTIIIMVLWSVILNPIRIGDMIQEQWHLTLEREKTEKNIMIERRIEANEIVGDIMSKLLFKYKCNRVMLLEKHNSVASLGNVDFLFLSCTLEMIDFKNPEIDYISENFQRQMTVNLLGNDVIGLLKHSKYLYFDDIQNYKKSQCRLLNKLKEVGEKQVIIYPFVDKKHRPLLILVICGDNLNVKEIVDFVDNYSQQISDLLIFE